MKRNHSYTGVNDPISHGLHPSTTGVTCLEALTNWACQTTNTLLSPIQEPFWGACSPRHPIGAPINRREALFLSLFSALCCVRRSFSLLFRSPIETTRNAGAEKLDVQHGLKPASRMCRNTANAYVCNAHSMSRTACGLTGSNAFFWFSYEDQQNSME